MSDLTVVSLFDGIGGFPLAFERAGARTVATVEIDDDAAEVSARHFPNATQFCDVTGVTGDDLRAVGFVPERGVITAGWPCQDLSVAGRRAGLAGERSGLWFEVVRLLGETRPTWFVGENVPGLISSNDGADFAQVLTDLNDLGYFVNVDILDAQYFGVPQRRRRVFLVCQSVDHILSTKTTSSALTISQCLTEILACILVVARMQSLTAYASSSLNQRWLSADGLRMRMKLFGLDAGPQNWLKSLAILEGEKAKSPHAQPNLESPSENPSGDLPRVATSSSDTLRMGSAHSSNTAWSWNNTWAEIYEAAKSCITSTPSKPITESTIFTCATALVSISERIAHWTSSSQTYSDATSSALTALEEFTSYARQTTSDLFGDVAWHDRWVDFLREADGQFESLRHLGVPFSAAAEVLFELEGGAGDSASGGEAGTGVAGAARAGVGVPSRSGGGASAHC